MVVGPGRSACGEAGPGREGAIMKNRVNSGTTSIEKGRLVSLAVAVLAVCFLTIGPTARPASAFIDVPDWGSTGWQNFGIQFASPFTGAVRFVVSDEGDNSGTS